MTLIVDAGPLVAFGDRNDPLWPQVRAFFYMEPAPLVVPAPVCAEVDYLLGRRAGRAAQRGFLADVGAGRFRVECLDDFEFDLLLRLDETYDDLNVGLADLSVVVLAHRFETARIATFDQRHFRALRPVAGGSFTLLPGDRG